jgi:hypothetical protein
MEKLRKRLPTRREYLPVFDKFCAFLLEEGYSGSTAHTYAQLALGAWGRGAQHMGDLAGFPDSAPSLRVRSRAFAVLLDWIAENRISIPCTEESESARKVLLERLGDDSTKVSEARGWANFRFWLTKKFRGKSILAFMACLNELFSNSPTQEDIFQKIAETKQPYETMKQAYQLYLDYCKEVELERVDPWQIEWNRKMATVFRAITKNYRAAPRNIDQKRELDRLIGLTWADYRSEKTFLGDVVWYIEGQMLLASVVEEYQKLFPYGPLSDMPGYDIPIQRKQLDIWLEETAKIN